MRRCALLVWLSRSAACVLLGGLAAAALAQPGAPAPPASTSQTVASQALPPASSAAPAAQPNEPETPDRQMLLQRLREAQARLTDLEQSVRALERQLEPSADASAAPARASSSVAPDEPTVPLHWLWLGVLTVIVLMIGVTYSGRPARTQAAPNPPPPATEQELVAFQTRLGTLDLRLDDGSPPPGHGHRQP